MVKKLEEVYPEFLNLTVEIVPIFDIQGAVTLFPPAEGGGEGLAKWAGTRFLGRIPMFTSMEQAGEKGECVINQGGNASVVVSKIVNGRKRDGE